MGVQKGVELLSESQMEMVPVCSDEEPAVTGRLYVHRAAVTGRELTMEMTGLRKCKN
jgi:hypothetical protein